MKEEIQKGVTLTSKTWLSPLEASGTVWRVKVSAHKNHVTQPELLNRLRGLPTVNSISLPTGKPLDEWTSSEQEKPGWQEEHRKMSSAHQYPSLGTLPPALPLTARQRGQCPGCTALVAHGTGGSAALNPPHPSEVRMHHPAQASQKSGRVQDSKTVLWKDPRTARGTRRYGCDESTFIPARDLLFSLSVPYYNEGTSTGIALILWFFPPKDYKSNSAFTTLASRVEFWI